MGASAADKQQAEQRPQRVLCEQSADQRYIAPLRGGPFTPLTQHGSSLVAPPSLGAPAFRARARRCAQFSRGRDAQTRSISRAQRRKGPWQMVMRAVGLQLVTGDRPASKLKVDAFSPRHSMTPLRLPSPSSYPPATPSLPMPDLPCSARACSGGRFAPLTL